MTAEQAITLQEIVASLSAQIARIQMFCPRETVEMLRIAKMAIQVELHGIGEDELDALVSLLRGPRTAVDFN